MDGQEPVRQEALVKELEGVYRSYMGQVMAAVNAAPNGRWIEGSEVRVNELMNQFKREVYQAALQLRIDAQEQAAAKSPAAFSPSGPGAGA